MLIRRYRMIRRDGMIRRYRMIRRDGMIRSDRMIKSTWYEDRERATESE